MLGRNLGNYQVVSKIGEGGMGVVYLARHLTLGRSAAVKVLHPELASNQDVVSRFFNEARAATAVRSPSIVEVFDFGFLDDRSAYIVMEFLEGENLAARMRRGPSSIPAMLITVRAIARALQAAHEHAIVHRDLKPDNIFLVPDPDLPGGERLKLLDFGIAKLSSVGEASHTRTGAVMGTPTYMAPEQCRGAGSVDHRADLYALGCIAYEMLCGQPPFVADGAGEIIARHLYFQPAPLRQWRPDAPAEIEHLVMQLLQKDPQARQATAADVARAAEQLMAAGVLPSHSEPIAAQSAVRAAAAMPTTLSGAAQASHAGVLRSPARSTRLIAGVAAAVVVIAGMAIWAGTRGGDAGQVAAGASTAGSSTMAAGQPRPLAPAAVPPAAAAPTNPVAGSSETPAGAPAALAAGSMAKPTEPPAADDAKPADPPAAVPAAPPAPVKSKAPAHPAHVKSDAARSNAAKADAARPDAPVEAPPDAAKAATGACTRAAFAAIVNADSPGEAQVQAALTRLKRCKALMAADVYADVQRELIGKL